MPSDLQVSAAGFLLWMGMAKRDVGGAPQPPLDCYCRSGVKLQTYYYLHFDQVALLPRESTALRLSVSFHRASETTANVVQTTEPNVVALIQRPSNTTPLLP
jgi:hypothetical protein